MSEVEFLSQPIHKDYNGSWYSIKWPHFWAIEYKGHQRSQFSPCSYQNQCSFKCKINA